jgi:hypothetical protein
MQRHAGREVSLLADDVGDRARRRDTAAATRVKLKLGAALPNSPPMCARARSRRGCGEPGPPRDRAAAQAAHARRRRAAEARWPRHGRAPTATPRHRRAARRARAHHPLRAPRAAPARSARPPAAARRTSSGATSASATRRSSRRPVARACHDQTARPREDLRRVHAAGIAVSSSPGLTVAAPTVSARNWMDDAPPRRVVGRKPRCNGISRASVPPAAFDLSVKWARSRPPGAFRHEPASAPGPSRFAPERDVEHEPIHRREDGQNVPPSWAGQDSNLRRTDYESAALTN